MHLFKQFIEANRQTGTTTVLIKAAKESSATLVVGNQNTKDRIIKNNPVLKDKVLTYAEVQSGASRGRFPAPILFDTDALWMLCTANEKMEIRPIVIRDNVFDGDGYINVDENGSVIINGLGNDGYNGKNDKQINIKLTQEDKDQIYNINRDFFEGEATRSMMGRILLRKGIQFYNKLRNSF